MENAKNGLEEIQRDQVFFIYDKTALKSEWDNPETAILYFSPTTVDVQEKCSLCGQLVGMIAFTENIFSSKPSVLKLKRGKFAVKLVSHFIMVLGGKLSDDDNLLSKLLADLYYIFQFYHKSFKNSMEGLSDHQDISARLIQIWSSYLPFAKHYRQDLFTFLDTVPYINFTKLGSFVYLRAMRILEACQRRSYVCCGCIMTDGRIIASQLQSNILRYLSLLKPNQDHLPVKQIETESTLPHGVRIFPVYLTKDEFDVVAAVSKQSPYTSNGNISKGKKDGRSRSDSRSSREHANSSSSVGSRNELPERRLTIGSDYDRSLRVHTESSDSISLDSNNDKQLESKLETPLAEPHVVSRIKSDLKAMQSGNDLTETSINKNSSEKPLPAERECSLYGSYEADSIWELEFSGKMEDLKECASKFNQSYDRNLKNQKFVGNFSRRNGQIKKKVTQSHQKSLEDNYNENYERQGNDVASASALYDDAQSAVSTTDMMQSNVQSLSDSKTSYNDMKDNLESSIGIPNSDTERKCTVEDQNQFNSLRKVSQEDNYENNRTSIEDEDIKIYDFESDLHNKQLDAINDQEVSHINSRDIDFKSSSIENVGLINSQSRNGEPEDYVIVQGRYTDSAEKHENNDNKIYAHTTNTETQKQGSVRKNEGDYEPSQETGCFVEEKVENVLKDPPELIEKVSDQCLDVDYSSNRMTSKSEVGYSDDASAHFSVGSLTENIKRHMIKKDSGCQVDAGYCSMDNDGHRKTSERKESETSAQETGTEQNESSDEETEEELISLHLYVQAHSNTVLVLFLEPQVAYDKKSLKSVYETVLPQLGDLEAHVQNVADSRDESTQDDFVYLRNNRVQRKCRSNCQFISQKDWNFGQTVQMLHSQFNNSFSFIDATFRNFTTAVYGKRTGDQETYYQQRGSYKPMQGAPTPYDMSCVMERRVGSKLRKDDLETII